MRILGILGTDLEKKGKTGRYSDSIVRVSNMEGGRRQVRRTERFERARNTATRSAAKGDALKKNKKKLDKSEWGGVKLSYNF